jgi:hypothetical protein
MMSKLYRCFIVAKLLIVSVVVFCFSCKSENNKPFNNEFPMIYSYNFINLTFDTLLIKVIPNSDNITWQRDTIYKSCPNDTILLREHPLRLPSEAIDSLVVIQFNDTTIVKTIEVGIDSLWVRKELDSSAIIHWYYYYQ